MVGGLLIALSLAPPAAAEPPPAEPPPAEPPPAEPPPAAAPSDRGYQGPESIEPPTDTPTPGAVATPADAAPKDKAEPAAGTTTAPVKMDLPPIVEKKPVPRLLSTIEDYPLEEQAVVGKRKVKFYPGIQTRQQVGWVSPFTIDRFGNEYAEGGFATGRIRWKPRLEIKKKFKIIGMLDLVNGRWAPSGSEDPVIDEIIDRGTPPGRTTLPIADPRELFIEYQFAFGLVRVGQQAFTWGQGMLANDGNNVDRFGDMRFGDDSRGDIYERFLFATKPFKYRAGKVKDLVIAVGADLVYRDERNELVDGDLAAQALAVVRYQPEQHPGNWIGGYLVYRNQTNADDGDVYPDDNKLEVGATSISGQGTKWLRDDLQLIGAFEAALIWGRTNGASDFDGGHKIVQGGGVARGYLGHHKTWLVGFDAGYASGDPDPNDRWINNFTFDAGHTVGLILFNQVHGWRTAQTEILATNGELTGEPLNGTQFLPTRGGVSNAIYIHPKARYSLWERLEFWGGPLIAAAPVPIVDPYTTRLAGGVPTNSANGDGGRRYYGTELDLGIRGRFDIRNFWLQAGLQGGLLLPGPGLANEFGNTDGTIGAIWFRTEIRY